MISNWRIALSCALPRVLRTAIGALDLRISMKELEEHDIVGEVGNPVLGQGRQTEQLWDFLGHHHTDVPAGERWRSEYVNSRKRSLSPTGCPEVPEAVDNDSRRPTTFDRAQ